MGASRPKKIPASAASSGLSPGYGCRSGSLSGGQAKKLGSRPALFRPAFSLSRPIYEKVTCSSWLRSGVSVRKRMWSLPAARFTTCQVPVSVAGSSLWGRSSISTPNRRLLSFWARLNSRRHQSDCSQSRLIKEHGLASVSRRVEDALPALARRDASCRIEIEERRVIPTVARRSSPARRWRPHCCG